MIFEYGITQNINKLIIYVSLEIKILTVSTGENLQVADVLVKRTLLKYGLIAGLMFVLQAQWLPTISLQQEQLKTSTK